MNADAIGQGSSTESVRADVVSEHLIAAAHEEHAVVAISGDDVACSTDADRVIDAEHVDADAVGQLSSAGYIGTDKVSEQLVAAAAEVDHQAVRAIAGDYVAYSGAADGVAGAGHIDADVVAQGGGAGSVRSDPVCYNDIAAGTAGEHHAVRFIAGDYVAAIAGTDRVVVSVHFDADVIAQGGGAAIIGADLVCLKEIAAAASGDQHTLVAIAGDKIDFVGSGAADGVASAGHLDADAVGQGGLAVGTGADVICEHPIAADVLADQHAVPAIAGDNIAYSGDADRVVVSVHLDADAIAQGSGAGSVHTDVVSEHLIAGGTFVDQYAVTVIAGDSVACPRAAAPDPVAVGVHLDADAVSQGFGAGLVGTDVVSEHLVAAAAFVNPHAIAAIAGDKVG